jgi:hypothetical protein
MALRSSLVLTIAMVTTACGGGNKTTEPPKSGGGGGVGEETPRVVIEDSKETWYEEPSGSGGGKGTNLREHFMDVTKRVEWKGGGGTMVDAGAPPADKVFRVFVRFPVPKVEPKDARDPHAVNRLLWDQRAEIAKCYYKGPGKEPGEEQAMVGWLAVNKAGDITDGGVEKSDEPMKKTGADDCVMSNVKGSLKFSAAGDDTKIRFKLKLQTKDVTGAADAKVAPK